MSELRAATTGNQPQSLPNGGEDAPPPGPAPEQGEHYDASAAVDSDEADDTFCIQLEPMSVAGGTAPRLVRHVSAELHLSSVHDDRPPSKHEIAQWKSIKNLKSGIT